MAACLADLSALPCASSINTLHAAALAADNKALCPTHRYVDSCYRSLYTKCWPDIAQTLPDDVCSPGGATPPTPVRLATRDVPHPCAHSLPLTQVPPPFDSNDLCGKAESDMRAAFLYPRVSDCRDLATFPCFQWLALNASAGLKSEHPTWGLVCPTPEATCSCFANYSAQCGFEKATCLFSQLLARDDVDAQGECRAAFALGPDPRAVCAAIAAQDAPSPPWGPRNKAPPPPPPSPGKTPSPGPGPSPTPSPVPGPAHRSGHAAFVKGVFIILIISAATILVGALVVYVRAQPGGLAAVVPARLFAPRGGPGGDGPSSGGRRQQQGQQQRQRGRGNPRYGASELLLDTDDVDDDVAMETGAGIVPVQAASMQGGAARQQQQQSATMAQAPPPAAAARAAAREARAAAVPAAAAAPPVSTPAGGGDGGGPL